MNKLKVFKTELAEFCKGLFYEKHINVTTKNRKPT